MAREPVNCRFFGFGYMREASFVRYWDGSETNVEYQMATVPLWFVLLLTLLLPVRWLWLTFRRREEVPERACEVCRYDLRAHSAGQRCPECGTMIPVKAHPG